MLDENRNLKLRSWKFSFFLSLLLELARIRGPNIVRLQLGLKCFVILFPSMRTEKYTSNTVSILATHFALLLQFVRFVVRIEDLDVLDSFFLNRSNTSHNILVHLHNSPRLSDFSLLYNARTNLKILKRILNFMNAKLT